MAEQLVSQQAELNSAVEALARQSWDFMDFTELGFRFWMVDFL